MRHKVSIIRNKLPVVRTLAKKLYKNPLSKDIYQVFFKENVQQCQGETVFAALKSLQQCDMPGELSVSLKLSDKNANHEVPTGLGAVFKPEIMSSNRKGRSGSKTKDSVPTGK